MPGWLAELAWTGSGLQRRVLIEAAGDRLKTVAPLGQAPVPPGVQVLPGLTIPGLANAHSHAFHRALRGRTEGATAQGDFWAWRRQMLALAASLGPHSYFELARATFGEMALAGITAVGEFHYLHHGPDGDPYPAAEMESALARAAAQAGVRLTLLDTCYLRGGFDSPLEGPARRFGDGDAVSWARRAERLEETPTVRLGAAIHSVRAVDATAIRQVGAWARERGAPLHLHLSEQPAENEACLRATGMTPTELLRECGALTPATTAVHAIHLSDSDIARLGEAGTRVCVCPTTERDLGDGVCPADRLLEAGAGLCFGSDSQAVVDLLEEARAVELNLRLVQGRRGLIEPATLLRAATQGGMAALGWDGGQLVPGQLADFASFDLSTPRLAGATSGDPVSQLAFAGTPADVRWVVMGGQVVVAEGRHLRLGDVAQELERVLAGLPDEVPA